MTERFYGFLFFFCIKDLHKSTNPLKIEQHMHTSMEIKVVLNVENKEVTFLKY